MIFKDRADAAIKLLAHIKSKKDLVVVSLLRGGVIIGDILSKGLDSPHLPLPVAKIPAPYNPELALGALCFDVVYLDPSIVNRFSLPKSDVTHQIGVAKQKFDSYCNRFNIQEDIYNIVGKDVVLVDDGIATGSTVRAALLYLKAHKPHAVTLAAPVAPADFDPNGFDTFIVLHQTADFSSLSQFYQDFSQITDDEVREIMTMDARK